MARQDGYNYFNGAPPVKPHRPRRRWVKWVAGSLVAVALVVWAAVAWYNTFIPGQRLANPIRQERGTTSFSSLPMTQPTSA